MKIYTRLFYSFFAIISIFCISGYFFGKGGLKQYSELLSYKNELLGNIENLESRKTELARNLSSVQNSGDYLVLSAREIGYFKKGQGIIRFGYPLGNIENNDYGHVIHRPLLSLADAYKRNLSALAAGLLCYIILTLIFRNKDDNPKEQT